MKLLVLVLFLSFSNHSIGQMQVLSVLQQKGADCFFHALKNGYYVYRWQNGDISKKECLNYILSSDESVFPLKKWKKLTKEKFNQIDNLNDLAGQYLIDQIKLKNYCFIIPNLKELIDFTKKKDQFLAMLDIDLCNILNDFRQKEDKLFIFILGNMHHISTRNGKLESSNGHWVSIVVSKKNDVYNYYAMDSLNRNLNEFYKQLNYLIHQGRLFQ